MNGEHWFVGVANTNSGFIAIVASVLHREANLNSFSRFSTERRYIGLTVTPKTLDLAILVTTTDRQTTTTTDKTIALPLAHARGVINLVIADDDHIHHTWDC